MENMDCPEEFKQMMEIDSDDDVESEEISETFICCICRDLLYKPVVLGCGHVSCFWCVHKSMNVWHKSQCPICRNHYYHFPYVCQALHFLLLKLYPNAYRRREKQTLGEEKEMDRFSPQLGSAACQLQPEETIIQPSDALQTKPVNPSNNKTGETSERMELAESILAHQESGCLNYQESGCLNYQVHREDMVASSASTLKNNDPNQMIHCNQVSVGDVLCGSCKRMLFRPIVLNCGHVFCICCVVRHAHEMLRCEVCHCPHPGDFPKVFLEFDHFLEEQFPTEYNLRRGEYSQLKQEQAASSSGAGSKSPHTSKSSGENPLFDGISIVHAGVGCDSCGMCPIVGDRYRCKDCKEEVGYDLCKDCYTSRSKIPGRFNQQHTSDHEFEVMSAGTPHAFGVFMEQFTNITAIAAALRGAYNTDISIYDETNEDADDDDVDAHLPSSERGENESDDEQSHEAVL